MLTGFREGGPDTFDTSTAIEVAGPPLRVSLLRNAQLRQPRKPGATRGSNVASSAFATCVREYENVVQEASKRLGDELKRLDEHRARLKEAGLGDVEIKRVIDPLESFHLQLKEEVEAYERLKRGEFEELDNLRGLGRLLITSRIAQGISQRELARRLGVHETQVSRDERNEYFGITLERAAKILDALNVRLRTQVAIEPLPPFPVAQAS